MTVYSREELERWRDRVHRRVPRLAVTTKRRALNFIQDVGFCFVFKAENSELPCLWHAARGTRALPDNGRSRTDPGFAFVWEMKDLLPAQREVFYGKLLLRRPMMVSLEYLPHFLALSGRTGERDEHVGASVRGALSTRARVIMDELIKHAPMSTQTLKQATLRRGSAGHSSFEQALMELQVKLYIAKANDDRRPHSFAWTPVRGIYGRELRKARRITPEDARRAILERYFRNQRVSTLATIRRLFHWSRQEIYQALGYLLRHGIIQSDVHIEGIQGRAYGLFG